MFFCVSFRSFAFPLRPARLAPRWCISAPPVRGVLRLVAGTRKPFFCLSSFFLRNSLLFNKNSVLLSKYFSNPPYGSALFRAPVQSPARGFAISCGIDRTIPKTPRESHRKTRRNGSESPRLDGQGLKSSTRIRPNGQKSAGPGAMNVRIAATGLPIPPLLAAMARQDACFRRVFGNRSANNARMTAR